MADRITYKEGSITLGGGETKYLLLPKSIFGAFYKGLNKVLGVGAKASLYMVGREFGRDFSEEMNARLDAGSYTHDMAGVSKVIVDMFMKLGFGKIELAEATQSKIVLHAYETPTSEVVKEAKEPVCHLERGMLAGLIENVVGKQVRVKETKCRARGDEYCEFVIEAS